MKNKDDYVTRNKNIVSFQPDKKSGAGAKKKRTIAVAGVVCVLCALGMVGIYNLESSNITHEEPLVDWEDNVTSDLEDKVQVQLGNDNSGDSDGNVTAELTDLEGNSNVTEDRTEDKNSVQTPETENVTEQSCEMPATTGEDTGSTVGQDAVGIEEEESWQTAGENAIALQFSDSDSLSWPVGGSIVLDYSMDATTYFPTLDQYKYNPAVLLQAEIGEKVCAAASGIVESIVESDETGMTVTMNIGNGYQLVYGQLQGIDYSTGSYIEKGAVVGTVATPTKYYSVEGSNLYFKMLKDTVPVNPVDYMREGQTIE